MTTTAAMMSFGRPTTAVTYRRNILATFLVHGLEHRLEQRLTELAAGREIAPDHDPPSGVPRVDAIDQHLAALRATTLRTESGMTA